MNIKYEILTLLAMNGHMTKKRRSNIGKQLTKQINPVLTQNKYFNAKAEQYLKCGEYTISLPSKKKAIHLHS